MCVRVCVRVLDIASVDLQALGAKDEMCKDRKCCRVGINEVASAVERRISRFKV